MGRGEEVEVAIVEAFGREGMFVARHYHTQQG